MITVWGRIVEFKVTSAENHGGCPRVYAQRRGQPMKVWGALRGSELSAITGVLCYNYKNCKNTLNI